MKVLYYAVPEIAQVLSQYSSRSDNVKMFRSSFEQTQLDRNLVTLSEQKDGYFSLFESSQTGPIVDVTLLMPYTKRS